MKMLSALWLATSLLAAEPKLVPVAVPPRCPYPPLARICRVEGSVPLAVTLDPDGQVAEVTTTGGPALLRGCALAYTRRVRFLPQPADGTPVRMTLPWTFDFPLPKVESASPRPAIDGVDLQIHADAPIDAQVLEAQIRTRLLQNGLPADHKGSGDGMRTLLVQVWAENLALKGAATSFTLRLRCSRKLDRDIDCGNNPDDGRAWAGGTGVACREAGSHPEALTQAMEDLLSRLDGSEPAYRRALTFAYGPLWVTGDEPVDGVVLVGDGGPSHRTILYRFKDLQVVKGPFTPAFPARAATNQWSGNVTLVLKLAGDGTTSEAQVVDGDPLFHAAALSNAFSLVFGTERPRDLRIVMNFYYGTWFERPREKG